MRRSNVLLAAAAAALLALTGASPGLAAPKDKSPKPHVTRYVALGDSYTAAPLVPTVIFANGCYQSTNNYPHQVARTLGVADFVDASCSGAQTKDMTTWQVTDPKLGLSVKPQFDSVTKETDLVTLGIGGNDFSVFGTLVGLCPTLKPTKPNDAPCRDLMRSQGQDQLFADIAKTKERVTTVIKEIKVRAPHAQIIVVGYPQILPRQGTCPALMPLAAGDYRYGNQVNQRLTMALRQAAAQQHVSYADVWKVSKGHDVCSSDPWINGQLTDVTRAQAFHPFVNEQTAVAGLVVKAVR